MDIVERLRKRAATWVSVGWGNNDIFDEVANEIERLRREREIFSQALDDANEWGGELYADNERLREALDFYAEVDPNKDIEIQMKEIIGDAKWRPALEKEKVKEKE